MIEVYSIFTVMYIYVVYRGHFFNKATIQENVTLLHSTALALNAI